MSVSRETFWDSSVRPNPMEVERAEIDTNIIAKALMFLRSQNLMHRDIKPQVSYQTNCWPGAGFRADK
jgi:serine/threonine protein kinase